MVKPRDPDPVGDFMDELAARPDAKILVAPRSSWIPGIKRSHPGAIVISKNLALKIVKTIPREEFAAKLGARIKEMKGLD